MLFVLSSPTLVGELEPLLVVESWRLGVTFTVAAAPGPDPAATVAAPELLLLAATFGVVAVAGGASNVCAVMRSEGLTLCPCRAARKSPGGSSGGREASVFAREAWKSGSAALKFVVGSICM